MAAAQNTGAAMVDALRPELEKAFRDYPPFGEVGFTVTFVDGFPSRIEYRAAMTRRLPPRSDRGGTR